MRDETDTKTGDLLELQARQQLAQVAEQYGDNLPYQRDRIVNECKFFLASAADAMLEAGKRLIVLKEYEQHGNFIKCLDDLGIGKRVAQAMMQATIKFTSPSLLPKAQTFALLGKSKLYELMLEDDDDLAELADGGTIAGMKLDDMERMTARELRILLREEREKSRAKDQVLANKNQKLDEMEGKLDTISRKLAESNKRRQLELPKPEEEGRHLRNDCTSVVASIETDGIARALGEAFTRLVAHTEKTGIDHTAFMAGCINQVLRTARQLQADFNLFVDDDSLTPYWDTEAAQQAADEAIAKLHINWDEVDPKDASHDETRH